MNLWFRLIFMLLRRPWKKPAGGMETTVISMRVWPNDLDINRHVTNGRYFTMADVGRMDYVLRSGAIKVALKHKSFPIVGDVWGKFRRELKLFETFEIHSRMLGWDEKWVFMEHRFVSKQRVVGTVIMRGLFRSAKGLIDPQEFIREMGLEPQSPALPDWLSNWSDSCDKLSSALRDEEFSPADMQQNT
ncbi:MAG: thioesterase [Oceanospirillaceae bacterium]|uniref:thioesterase family protein n=1 Tax=unclassified Thalassolituus TaxID=2624967 RepID=UPI000C3DD364|nr:MULTISPECIES: thioesterase family protein [unclassified Thalassolituus]MAS25320.1 thioesterase [Oceanospirillaceae bacterium]MAY00947.1 thioesterase [Oceanospirillaceae bacterium]MBL34696.1 thioesterase [Oceanospirillaceae bacterium]MBS52434.1 thioesterase [Oceanospirillaceae bacterium]|tara:strand:- start:2479 stop:3045 length:567 start_codon:yes stop_codon:yes gene_type:complete